MYEKYLDNSKRKCNLDLSDALVKLQIDNPTDEKPINPGDTAIVVFVYLLLTGAGQR